MKANKVISYLFSRYTFLQLAAAGVLLVFGSAVIYAATSYRVNNTVVSDINEHSNCRKVTNNSGGDLFVPTNTAGEWSSFYNNPPTGVTIGSNCDVIVTFSGAASGTHNLSTSGTLNLTTTGSYTISFNVAGTIRVKGVAGGGGGGGAAQQAGDGGDGYGGGGGGGGAANLVGVSVSVSATNYSAAVGAGGSSGAGGGGAGSSNASPGGTGGTTSFASSLSLSGGNGGGGATNTGTPGSGGSGASPGGANGGAGGAPGTTGSNGTTGGGGGGVNRDGGAAGNGGNGQDQSGAGPSSNASGFGGAFFDSDGGGGGGVAPTAPAQQEMLLVDGCMVLPDEIFNMISSARGALGLRLEMRDVISYVAERELANMEGIPIKGWWANINDEATYWKVVGRLLAEKKP